MISMEFEGKRIRGGDQGGNLIFCGSDVATALGYTNPSEALNDHCKALKMFKPSELLGLGIPNPPSRGLLMIREPDIYRQIIGSKLPDAERFERWVFEEVLPSIRKTGSYTVDPQPAQPTQDERLLQYLEQDRLERIAREDRLFTLLGAPRRSPEARSTEAHAPQSWSVTETAAELTMTAQKLYKELRRLRWIDGKPDAWGPIREEGKPYLTWAARTKPHHNDQIRINAAGKVELKREFREPRAAINNYFASTGKPH